MKKQCLLLACIAALHPACADDPFAAFADLEAAAATAQVEPAGPVALIGHNLSGTVALQYTGFFNDREPQDGGDHRNHFWNTAIDLETWTGAGIWTLHATGRLQYGNQHDTFSGIYPAPGRFLRDKDDQTHRIFNLNELYLTLEFNDWDLTLGKKIFSNGLSPLYSPADTLRPVAGFDPFNVQDQGIWQVRADLYQNEHTWTVAVLPVYQPDKVPHNSSRWVNAPVGGDPVTIYPESKFSDFGWFGRFKTVQNGWDLFASIYAGPGRQYVIKEPTPLTLERRVPDVINPAAGYSTTRGRWEFHGEVAYTDSLNGRDQSFISTVQGTTITIDGDPVSAIGLEQILATFQVAWEWRTGHQTAENYIHPSESVRAGQSDLISRLRFKVNEDLEFEYNGHVILENWGYANRFGVSWEFARDLTWRSGVEFFGGSSGGGPIDGLNNLGVNYGGWKRNNRFVSSIEYVF